jgi:hypothetical protein
MFVRVGSEKVMLEERKELDEAKRRPTSFEVGIGNVFDHVTVAGK